MAFKTIRKYSDVTLYRTGILYISSYANAKWFAQHPLVRIEYDADTRTVALTPTSHSGGNTFTATNASRRSRNVSLKALLKQERLTVKGSIFADLEERGGRLCFEIPAEAVEKCA